MTDLTKFERAAIEYIIETDAPEYQTHIPYLSIDRRESTGAGIYVYFKYSDTFTINSDDNRTIGQSIFAEVEGLKEGAGFMLYIDHGQISMLESFSNAYESWPAKIENFSLQVL